MIQSVLYGLVGILGAGLGWLLTQIVGKVADKYHRENTRIAELTKQVAARDKLIELLKDISRENSKPFYQPRRSETLSHTLRVYN